MQKQSRLETNWRHGIDKAIQERHSQNARGLTGLLYPGSPRAPTRDNMYAPDRGPDLCWCTVHIVNKSSTDVRAGRGPLVHELKPLHLETTDACNQIYPRCWKAQC